MLNTYDNEYTTYRIHKLYVQTHTYTILEGIVTVNTVSNSTYTSPVCIYKKEQSIVTYDNTLHANVNKQTKQIVENCKRTQNLHHREDLMLKPEMGTGNLNSTERHT